LFTSLLLLNPEEVLSGGDAIGVITNPVITDLLFGRAATVVTKFPGVGSGVRPDNSGAILPFHGAGDLS
jgi:hypothetical protein